MKKFRFWLVIIWLIISFSCISYASDIKVYINNVEEKFDPNPLIQDGSTLVPMRQCFESLDANVFWDEKTRSAIAKRDNINIKVTIDKNTAYINGKAHILKVAPQIISDKTYVPLRFISESLGAQVFWDGNSRTITIIDIPKNKIELLDSEKFEVITEHIFVNSGDEVDAIIDIPLGALSTSPYQTDTSLTIDQEPSEYYYDNFGNKYAVIKINGIRKEQSVKIKVKKELVNSGIKYLIDSDKKHSAAADKIYTSPQYQIESDNKYLIEKAKDISYGETNPFLIAKQVFGFVNSYLTYDEDNSRKGALETLLSGKGVCEDYSKLFVGLLRASSVPARSVDGILIDEEFQNQMKYNEWYDALGLVHEWPEFYIDGYGWVIAEPTFTFTYNGVKTVPWDQFANQSSNGHILIGYDGEDQGRVKWRVKGRGVLGLELISTSIKVRKLE